ncbi:MAG: flagellar export protein FliJ [Clostridia bacterium]|nr:flagellar export protein FliJ [Clostridia bacterium]
MTNKFKFEKVLNLKQKQEEQIKIQLKRIYDELEVNKQKLEDIRQKKRELEGYLKEQLEKGIDISDLKIFDSSLNSYAVIYKNKKEVIRRINRQSEECKDDLIKKMTERKMYEKLKDKFNDVVAEQEKRIEQKTIDEFVSFANSKKRRDWYG